MMTEPLPIDLWIWPLSPPCPAHLAAQLSPDEKDRAARFIRADHAAAYQIGRGRLREILSARLGQAPADLRFSYGDHGKPFLPNGPSFNLSHSGGWAALAVTNAQADLGLDIEAHRPVEPGVAHRFFSTQENATLAPLTGPAWRAAFFRCWTRKEAVVKAVGDGLSIPLDAFDVTLGAGETARVTRLAAPLGHPNEWRLTHLDLGPAITGALALRGSEEVHLNWHGHPPPLPIAPKLPN